MEEKKSPPETSQGKGGSRAILFLLILVVPAAAGGAWFMAKQSASSPAAHAADGHEQAASKLAKAQYVALDPAFVVNLSDETDSGRYLQLEVQVMSRDPAVAEAIEHHAPVIRNHLLLLFGQQKYEQLRIRADKERLQAEALAEVRKILKTETGRPVVEGLYFTSFVMQ